MRRIMLVLLLGETELPGPRWTDPRGVRTLPLEGPASCTCDEGEYPAPSGPGSGNLATEAREAAGRRAAGRATSRPVADVILVAVHVLRGVLGLLLRLLVGLAGGLV